MTDVFSSPESGEGTSPSYKAAEAAAFDQATHGPYCAYCGACKSCFDAGEIVDRHCWDDPRVDDVRRYGKHSWNRDHYPKTSQRDIALMGGDPSL